MLRESWQREKPTAPIIMENGLVIIAVEGPSAAGKTTWCRTQLGGESAAERFVAEYQPTGFEPDGTDLDLQASYWTTVNSKRWSQAEDLEARTGIALCDSEPAETALQLVSRCGGRSTSGAIRVRARGSRDSFRAPRTGFRGSDRPRSRHRSSFYFSAKETPAADDGISSFTRRSPSPSPTGTRR